MSTGATSRMGIDVIGDVHGHLKPLLSLLLKLGYAQDASGTFRHPENRRALFVGDLLNRGPHVRETLQIVRAMAEANSAIVILGNHEFNLLGMDTKGANGFPLRPHSKENLRQVAETRSAFRDFPEEWSGWLSWMRTLPLSLELDGLRASHAAWHQPSLEVIDGRTFENQDFLRAACLKKSPEAEAVRITLKGIKVVLPENRVYRDRFGIARTKSRIRWWMNPANKSYAELTFPPISNAPQNDGPPASSTDCVAPYPQNDCPHFFGHYCLPPTEPKIHGNVVCVDGCVTCDGKLWAYRFDGEAFPEANKLIHAG